MFPLKWNLPFRKKDGSLVKLSDAMGGDYNLPTASANTKGGIKVGSGLKMTGDKMSVDIDPELPAYGIADAGKVLGVDENGELAWVTVSGAPRQYGASRILVEKDTIEVEVEGAE